MSDDDITPEQVEAGRRAAKEALAKRGKKISSNVFDLPVIFKPPPEPSIKTDTETSPTIQRSLYDRIEYHLPVLTLFGWSLLLLIILILGVIIWYATYSRFAPPQDECSIKGKVSASGMVYHTPESLHYGEIIMNLNRGDQWFCSVDQAKQAGFDPLQ